MSFWEDRFVNRPHAGAAPSPYLDVQGSAYPHLPSPDEPAWGSAEVSEGSEVSLPADEIESPVELVEVVALRRRPTSRTSLPRTTRTLFSADEAEADVEADPVEQQRRGSSAAASRPSRSSAGRRGRVVGAAGRVGTPTSRTSSSPRAGASSRSPSHEFSYEQSPPRSSRREEARLLQTPQEGRDRERRRDRARGHARDRVGREPVAHHELRGRRACGRGARASADVLEEPVEEPKKRGLFRRRKSEPVEEPVAEDADAEPLEDESFENVTYWGSEVSEDVGSRPRAGTETEPDESNTYVYGEDESQAADEAPAAPAEPEVAAEEPRTGRRGRLGERGRRGRLRGREPEPVETDRRAEEPKSMPPRTSRSVADEPDSSRTRPRRGRARARARAGARRVASPPTTQRTTRSTRPATRSSPSPCRSRRRTAAAREARRSSVSRSAPRRSPPPSSQATATARLSSTSPAARSSTASSSTASSATRRRSPTRSRPSSRITACRRRTSASGSRRAASASGRSTSPASTTRTRFDNAVRFKAHEVLPVAAHESVLDYRVVEERYTESGRVSRRVLLVVAPRDQVEPYIEACREAGLRLAGVDLEAFGLLRAFVPPLGSRSRTEDSATVVVAIGHEASTLLVAGGGICEFTRVFDWGGGALQDGDRRGARRAAHGGGDDPHPPLARRPRTPPRLARRRHAQPRSRGGSHEADAVRPGARQLAPVLPDPARVARHPRDRHHRRHRRTSRVSPTRCTR